MSPKKKSKYKIGQFIIHHQFGVGEISNITEKGLGEDRKLFYKVKTKKNTYWLPVGNEDSNRIEPLRDKKQFEKALDIIASKPKKIAKNHNSRKTEIRERWNDGSLESRARLLRDLNGRAIRKHLNFYERQTLKDIRTQMIDEWVLVKPSLERKEAKKRIQCAMKESAKKVRVE